MPPFLFTYTAVVLSVICLSIAAFLLLKKREDRRGRWLALYSLSVAVWIASNALADVMSEDGPLIFWSGMALVGASFAVSSYLFFVHSFADGRPGKLLTALYLAPAIVLSAGAFSRHSVVATAFPPGVPTQIVPGVLYTVLTYILFGSMLYGSFLLLRHALRATRGERLQSLYVGLGFLLLFFGMLTFNLILPLRGEYRFYTLGTQFSLFFAAFSAYAIVRHRLLDIKVVIQRGIVFTVSLGTVVLLYFALLYAALLMNGSLAQRDYLLVSVATAALGIFTVPFLQAYFIRLTDGVFFKDRVGYAEAMRSLTQVLDRSIELDDLTTRTVSELGRIFKTDDVRFVVLDGEPRGEHEEEPADLPDIQGRVPPEFMAAFRAGRISPEDLRGLAPDFARAKIVVPVVLQDRMIALLGLGRKKSDDPYFPEDIAILQTFSSLAAMAVEKARLYREVKEYSEGLEEKVRARTAEIRRLQENQSRTFYDIAHNLQTPMTIIKGRIGALRVRHGDDRELTAFERSIDKISGFVTRLLRLASLTNAEASGMTALDLSALVEDVVEYFRPQAEQDGIALEATIAPGLRMAGNKAQLEELLLNLLSNAAKFIADGRRIEVTLADAGGGKVRLSVRDTGVGIAPEDLTRLFDRFYRAKSGAAKEGSGLGLAICKRITELHGGTIAITSAPGHGTTVTLTLPMHP